MLRIEQEGLSVTLRSWDFLLGAQVQGMVGGRGKATGTLRVITKGMTSEFSFRSSFYSRKSIFIKHPPPHTPNNPLQITHHGSKNITLTLQTQRQDDASPFPYLSLHVDTYFSPDCHALLREISLTIETRSRDHIQKLTNLKNSVILDQNRKHPTILS